MSTWTAFIEPIVDSPLLTVITGAQVKSLVFDGGGRAVGIRLSRPGLLYAYRTDPGDSRPAPDPGAVAGHRAALLGGRDRLRRRDRLAPAAAAVRHRPGRRPARARPRRAGRPARRRRQPARPRAGDGAVRVVADDSRGQGQQPGGAPVRRQRPGDARPRPAAADVALPDAGRGLPAARLRRRLRDRGRPHPPAQPRPPLAPLGRPGRAPGDGSRSTCRSPPTSGRCSPASGSRARSARPAPSRTGAPARSPPAPTCAPTRTSSSTACAT